MCEINRNPGRASSCMFHRHEVDGTGLVHEKDRVILTKKFGDHLRSKWDVEVQSFEPGAIDKKQIRVLNRTLT